MHEVNQKNSMQFNLNVNFIEKIEIKSKKSAMASLFSVSFSIFLSFFISSPSLACDNGRNLLVSSDMYRRSDSRYFHWGIRLLTGSKRLLSYDFLRIHTGRCAYR